MMKVFQKLPEKQRDEKLLTTLRLRAWACHGVLVLYFALKWLSTDWEYVKEACTAEELEIIEKGGVGDCIPIEYDSR